MIKNDRCHTRTAPGLGYGSRSGFASGFKKENASTS